MKIGINFRNTSGYVTDGTDEVPWLGESYPATKMAGSGQSVTAGWESGFTSGNERDRDNGIDARLAGIHFESGGTVCRFRIDLDSTGDHDIRAAFGDPGASGNYSEFEFLDSTTSLFQSGSNNDGISNWRDATDVQRTSAADWVSNNAKRTETFASTIFRTDMNYQGVNSSGAAVISHLFVESVGGGGGAAAVGRLINGGLVNAGLVNRGLIS